MPDSGGVFTRLYQWVAQAAAGFPIDQNKVDADSNDMATALSNRIFRDGTGAPTADTPWGNHKITGLAPGANPGEAVTFDQIQTLLNSATSYQYLDNASFRVNARNKSGTVTLAAGAYGHDRWKAGSGGCTYTFTQSGANVQITITAGSLLQIISGGDVDSGVYTLSADPASTAQARVYQGSVTSYSPLPVTSAAITGNSPMTIEFSTGVVLKPMLGTGSLAHAWAKLPYEAEVARCEWYYEVLDYAVGFGPGPSSPNVGGSAAMVYFRTRKRSLPTCTITASVSTNISVTNGGADVSGLVLAVFNSTSNAYCKGVGTITASCEP